MRVTINGRQVEIDCPDANTTYADVAAIHRTTAEPRFWRYRWTCRCVDCRAAQVTMARYMREVQA